MAIMVLCEGPMCCNKIHRAIQDIKDQNNPLGFKRITASKEYVQNIKSQPELYTPIEWIVQRNGYAWGYNTVGKWLAFVVLLLHMLFVGLHLVFAYKRKWSPEKWGNLVDLIALAVQISSVDKAPRS